MRRPVVFVMLAGVAALVAAIVVYSALKKREAAVDAAIVKSVNVEVAARDLPIGSKIDASAIKTVRWSKDDLPPGAFMEPGPLMNQYTRTSFVQNEPIVADRLFSGDKNAGVLPLLIPNGMRAVSVPVDEVSDIAGFVLPHAHVDILVSVDSGGGQLSKIVLQDVEVLAVAQEVENANADKPQVVHVVTLLVTPEEAEKLVLASHQGALRLAMRNYDDKKVVATSGVTLADLLRGSGAPPTMVHQAAAAPVHTAPRAKPVEVEILRNGKSVENVSFVHSHSGASSAQQPAADQPDTSAADTPDKTASAAEATGKSPTGLEAGSLTGKQGLSNGAPAGLMATDSSNGGQSGSAGNHTDSSAAGFSTPHSKTIDLP